MRWLLLSVVVALGATDAVARPAADVVIVWAPGVDVAPVTAVAREVGAAVIDRTPRPAKVPTTARLVARGIAAYDALQLSDAARLLDEARVAVDRTGAAGLSQIQLSDLFLYRGLVKSQGGDATAAWDELVTTVVVAPTRLLDPGRFPPRVASELDRARSSLTDRATARLEIVAPSTCAIRVDGVPGTPAAPLLLGPHWIDVRCADRAPWGTRVELTADAVITAANTALTRPSRDDLLIQARTAGAAAFVEVDVVAGVASARLIGIDGRERDRRSVTVTGTLAPLGPLLRELLVPVVVVTPAPWYRSRWVWAAGAALIATAIAVPVTALIARDGAPTSWTGDLQGVPPSWGQP